MCHHNQHFSFASNSIHCFIYWSIHSSLVVTKVISLSMNDENFIKRCVCTRCRTKKKSLFILLQIFPLMCKNSKERCQKENDFWYSRRRLDCVLSWCGVCRHQFMNEMRNVHEFKRNWRFSLRHEFNQVFNLKQRFKLRQK